MKAIYSCIAIVLFVFTANAQVAMYHFPQPGLLQTEVHIGDWTIQGQVDNWSFQYTGDTVVGADTFSHLVRYNAYFPSQYIYSSGGKVYGSPYQVTNFVHPDSMELIYDFNLTLGDTFHINRISIYGTFTVDSVGTILLASGETRKYMELSNSTGRLKWIDGIGDIERGIFYVDDFEGGHEQFICTSDSAGPEYSDANSSFNCNPQQPITYGGNSSCGIFNYNYNITTPSCVNNCDASISITNISGGTPGYTYAWSPNGSTSQSASGLCTGYYYFTITDNLGNTCTHTFYVPNATPITITPTVISSGCGNAGYACVNVSGGTAPYFYNWSPAGGNQPCTPHYLYPGSYYFSAMDANGCMSTYTVTIPMYPQVYATTTLSSPSCLNCCDGNIVINSSGGHGPLTITHPANETWPAAGNFCTGMYHYCVTDTNGCSYCDSVYLGTPLQIEQHNMENDFSVYPNPAAHEINVDINEPVDVFIYDPSGQLIMEKKLVDGHNTIEVSALSSGIYFVQLSRSDGKTIRKKVVILH